MSSEPARFVVAEDADAAAEAAARELAGAIDRARSQGRPFYLSLAGGSTPRKLYETLARDPFRTQIDWSRVHLFFGDERCVPPNDPNSNYRMVRESLLSHVPIPAAQVHRIRGEDPPDREAARYESQLARFVPAGPDGVPRFDWILLGVGEDGHTASLFPGQSLAPTGRLCGVARHPTTGVARVSFTRELILAADVIAFLVTGAAKAAVVGAIRDGRPEARGWPAADIASRGRGVTWFIDRAAEGAPAAPARRGPVALVAADLPPRTKTNYPEPFASRIRGREKRALGDAFGLTNFGVNLTRLVPGAISALRHAHSKQDELVYILQGRPTLRTDEGATVLAPGMCAGFKAGTGNGHHLANETNEDVVYLEVGDRTPGDEGSYPDDDLKAALVDGKWAFTHKDGRPY